MAADSISWGDSTIAYRYGFADRRTLAITVMPDRSVRVSAPRGTSLEAIRSKVEKRAGWIHAVRQSLEKFQPMQPPRRFVPGETHRYLGRQYRLRWTRGQVRRVSLRRGFIEVVAPALPGRTAMRRMVFAWLLGRAQEILAERLSICHRLAPTRGSPPPRLVVRFMARRWGSCSKGGRLTLNVELIKAPRECIDYVITHELCHLVEHNHGPRFWRLLSRLMPDWEARRERLNRMADI